VDGHVTIKFLKAVYSERSAVIVSVVMGRCPFLKNQDGFPMKDVGNDREDERCPE
jgi:hypothetical protein